MSRISGFPETAFLLALSSAHVALAVSQSCSKGEIFDEACQCHPSDWMIKGCPSALSRGLRVSRKLLAPPKLRNYDDSLERKRKLRRIPRQSTSLFRRRRNLAEVMHFKRHNLKVGRLVSENSPKKIPIPRIGWNLF